MGELVLGHDAVSRVYMGFIDALPSCPYAPSLDRIPHPDALKRNVKVVEMQGARMLPKTRRG